jgi:acrylyl-CoA reductase (NADPH)
MDLPASVAPFILRGVTLRGIDSVTVPRPRRLLAWARLATDLDVDRLSSMVSTIGLDEVPSVCQELLKGTVRGRVVVDVNR